LNTLDWHDIYRRRVCIERNWRDGKSKHTVIPLSCPNDFEEWERIDTYAIDALVRYGTKTPQPYTMQAFVAIEPTGHSSIVHSFNDGTKHTPEFSALAKLESSDRNAGVYYKLTMMTNRFVVTVINYHNSDPATTEVRSRGTLELRMSQSIPYTRIHSASGRWALLYIHHRSEYGPDAHEVAV
jgi:hypothetical protein